MTVAAILNAKGREVLMAPLQTSVEEISKLLHANRVGAIVIVEESGKICGIASERDVVTQLAQKGKMALVEPISACMTKNVVSCKETDSIDSVMSQMTKGRFRHLPVVENGQLAGIISIGDVVKIKIETAERDAEELKRYIAG